MRRRNFLLSSSVAVLMLGGFILAGPTAHAQQAKRSNINVRWEYCVVSRSTMYAKETPGVPREFISVTYFQATGSRVERVYIDAKAFEPGKEELAKVIAKLGMEGWEMVAKEPSDNIFYFKRRKS